ncbi:hypothetical protein PIB30_050760 [Stylosanthes scabra]|uniref:Uncharacterized protein n=1 Tax=Stylosanthes scabra TaxID=79078 RepID=A0ABU6UII5_9FABA|nr:hypothetical protein [Stylosanthes scabra]
MSTSKNPTAVPSTATSSDNNGVASLVYCCAESQCPFHPFSTTVTVQRLGDGDSSSCKQHRGDERRWRKKLLSNCVSLSLRSPLFVLGDGSIRISSSEGGDSDETDSGNEGNNNVDPLIQISDMDNVFGNLGWN